MRNREPREIVFVGTNIGIGKSRGPAAASPPQSQAACLKKEVSSVTNAQPRTPPRAPAQS